MLFRSKEEIAATLPLTREEQVPRLLRGQVKDMNPGNYRIQLEIPDIQAKIDAQDAEEKTEVNQRWATFAVLPPEGGEMQNLATNWELLESLARLSKGELLTADNATRLVDLLARRIVTKDHSEPQRLWQDEPLIWWVLAVFLLLLSVEWIGRKWAGLP